MTTRPRNSLILEIEESDGNSIAGRLSDGAGQSTEFTGWLGLAAALEAAVHGGEEGDEPLAAVTGSLTDARAASGVASRPTESSTPAGDGETEHIAGATAVD